VIAVRVVERIVVLLLVAGAAIVPALAVLLLFLLPLLMVVLVGVGVVDQYVVAGDGDYAEDAGSDVLVYVAVVLAVRFVAIPLLLL